MARTNNSADNGLSRYVQGGDVERYPNRLGWWERRVIERAEDDIPITLSNSFDKRPDLLAFTLYGKPNYGWLILQYNNIVDINEEFVTGKEILVPSPARVSLAIMTNQPGGVPATE